MYKDQIGKNFFRRSIKEINNDKTSKQLITNYILHTTNVTKLTWKTNPLNIVQ